MNRIESKVLIAVLTFFGTLTTFLVNDVRQSIDKLNSKIEILVEKSINQENRISRTEEEIKMIKKILGEGK